MVVEGPAGQDFRARGSDPRIYTEIVGVWLLFRCRNSQEGPRASVCERRSGNAIRPHPAVPRPGRMGCRAVALPNSVRLIHNRGNLACGPDFKVSHYPSARVFAEHDPAAIAWRGECRQRGLCPNPDLPCASRAAELLDAVGVHGRTGAPVPQIAAARAERVRSLDRDIARVEASRKNCAMGA